MCRSSNDLMDAVLTLSVAISTSTSLSLSEFLSSFEAIVMISSFDADASTLLIRSLIKKPFKVIRPAMPEVITEKSILLR